MPEPFVSLRLLIRPLFQVRSVPMNVLHSATGCHGRCSPLGPLALRRPLSRVVLLTWKNRFLSYLQGAWVLVPICVPLMFSAEIDCMYIHYASLQMIRNMQNALLYTPLKRLRTSCFAANGGMLRNDFSLNPRCLFLVENKKAVWIFTAKLP